VFQLTTTETYFNYIEFVRDKNQKFVTNNTVQFTELTSLNFSNFAKTKNQKLIFLESKNQLMLFDA